MELETRTPSHLAPTGKPRYDQAARVFGSWLAGRPLTELSIAGFFSALRSGDIEGKTGPYSASTQALFKPAIKAAILAAGGEQVTAGFRARVDALFSAVKTPKRDGRVLSSKTLSGFEVGELSRNAPEKVAVFSRFLFLSGLRITEALSLRLSDCTPEQGRVSLRVIGKGSKERTVKVSLRIFEAVKQAFGSETYLFQNSRSKSGRFSRQAMHKSLALYGQRVLKRKVGCHTFRHSNATALLKAGATLAAVSQHLGHSSPSVTASFYDHTEIEASVFEQLEGVA